MDIKIICGRSAPITKICRSASPHPGDLTVCSKVLGSNLVGLIVCSRAGELVSARWTQGAHAWIGGAGSKYSLVGLLIGSRSVNCRIDVGMVRVEDRVLAWGFSVRVADIKVQVAAILSNRADVSIVNCRRTNQVFVLVSKIRRSLSIRLLGSGVQLAVGYEPRRYLNLFFPIGKRTLSFCTWFNKFEGRTRTKRFLAMLEPPDVWDFLHLYILLFLGFFEELLCFIEGWSRLVDWLSFRRRSHLILISFAGAHFALYVVF